MALLGMSQCFTRGQWSWPCFGRIVAGGICIFAWYVECRYSFAQPHPVAANDIANKNGFVGRTFVDDSGDSHRYVIFIPYKNTNGKPPVLMFLNGVGENGDDGLRQISNNFGVNIWETREFFPFLVIAPQCRSHGSWSADSLDVRWAMQILDQTIREFGADEDRVYLTGVSSGGNGVWSVGAANLDRFAAIVPMCGSGGGDVLRLVRSRLPIWNFYNDRDALTLVESNRVLRRQLIEQGSSPIVTEYPAAGHDCWNRAYRTTALYAWLLEQRRSKNREARGFQYLPAGRLLAEWQALGVDDWKERIAERKNERRLEATATAEWESSHADAWAAGTDGDPRENRLKPELQRDTVLIGRGDESLGRSVLVSNTASRSVEIHGDVWMRSDSQCRIGILDEESTSANALVWISIVPSDLGTGGILHAKGEWSGRLDPAAQRSLRVDSWNDVRVRCVEGRIAVHLNGWPAVDFTLKSDRGAAITAKYRFALATPDDGSDIRWRYVRTRYASESMDRRKETE